ncbi:MAG: sugar phosphate isomerase/epimerase [Armatimonadetes bacterium]|nr:sugar phosphate isomerase/epimerase [Armatimonadota bacterium]
MVDACARLGIDGLELLGVHFKSAEPGFLHALKQHAFRRGVALIAVSAHHNFVTPDPGKRREEIDKVCRWVDVAHEIGAPAVRVFGGRWATRPNFAEFMSARGEEPPLEGYTEAEGYAWNAEALRIAAYYAGRKGVTLALENHWGFTGTADGVLRILDRVDSPWLRVVLDTGNFNFSPDPYGEMERLAPHALMVHAKTYIGGGIYYTADLDYGRIAGILKDAGFQGYVSLEFEGKAHPDRAIPKSIEMLGQAMKG